MRFFPKIVVTKPLGHESLHNHPGQIEINRLSFHLHFRAEALESLQDVLEPSILILASHGSDRDGFRKSGVGFWWRRPQQRVAVFFQHCLQQRLRVLPILGHLLIELLPGGLQNFGAKFLEVHKLFLEPRVTGVFLQRHYTEKKGVIEFLPICPHELLHGFGRRIQEPLDDFVVIFRRAGLKPCHVHPFERDWPDLCRPQRLEVRELGPIDDSAIVERHRHQHHVLGRPHGVRQTEQLVQVPLIRHLNIAEGRLLLVNHVVRHLFPIWVGGHFVDEAMRFPVLFVLDATRDSRRATARSKPRKHVVGELVGCLPRQRPTERPHARCREEGQRLAWRPKAMVRPRRQNLR
mmetsp:Transcript_33365/g.92103  ORF Transcript_33365/g.92103 Transcript_33365/m.92103 type:complete len:349 (+) Transcript_33365:376-1422(+)